MSNLETMIYRKDSFLYTSNSIFIGEKDCPSSNIDGFLWIDTYVFQLSSVGLFGTNIACLQLEVTKLQKEHFSITN
jgi:hypothetical protein